MKDAHDPGRHAPTDDFIAYLERDVRRAARHRERFATLAAPSKSPARRMGTAFGIAASVLASLSVGVVLGASANAAAASEPSQSRSAFAIQPIQSAFKTIGCAATAAPVSPSRDDVAGSSRAVLALPAASARAAQAVAAVHGLLETRDGRVLVNDGLRRQLRLFDADLSSSALVLDSIPVDSRSYLSAGLGTIRSAKAPKLLLPFRGDSSLFGPDGPPEQNMIVLDGRGHAVRTLSLASIGQPIDSLAVFDPKGRLVYRQSSLPSATSVIEVPVPRHAVGTVNPFSGRGAVNPTMRVAAGRGDSLAIVRVDLDTRAVDTVGRILLPPDGRPGENGVGNGGGKLVAVSDSGGKPTGMKQVISPLPIVDDWAVLSDGTIAIVRGRDYHVDWIHLDGTRISSPKLPFEWRRLSAADKQRIVDSTRAAVDSLDAVAVAAAVSRAPRRPDGPVLRQWPYEIVAPARLPDVYPAIRTGAAKPDADGNLWILTTARHAGAAVYDVVNPTRGLVRRVRLPAGRSIVGFGPGGTVYLAVGDPATGIVVERTTLLPRVAQP